jgi:ubiquinone biosynthesis protein COQ9
MTARKTKPKSDAALKEAVLMAALENVPFDGFTDAVLAKAGEEAGADDLTMARLFPDGAKSLVEAFSDWADAEMLALLAATDLKAMKVRERISAAILARLEAVRDHKEAARRAGAWLTLPPHAALGMKLVYRTVDAMWRAAGDTSTDFNFYTKRAILAGVYSSTLVRWFNDDSEDEEKTHTFLAHRIDDVMRFEKLKAQVKKSLSGIPSPFSPNVRSGARRSARR